MTALLLVALIGAQQPTTAGESVALIIGAAGDVRVTAPGGPPAAAGRLTWLADGTRIETSRAGTATIVFWSGRRWQVEDSSAARVGKDGLTRLSGKIAELEKLPALPHLPPIAGDTRASGFGSVRLRGGNWVSLYPRHGAHTVADATVLTFEPKQAGGPYRVEVIDEDGTVVFETQTPATWVAVPAGRLRQGVRYTWMVRPPELPGAGAGAGEFVTLDRAADTARRALHAAQAARDAAGLAMLAEIDLALGLLPEARRGFEDALTLAPDDPVLRARVDELRAAAIPAVRRYLNE